MKKQVLSMAITAAAALSASPALGQSCDAGWSHGFALVEANRDIHVLAAIREGAADALYVGGEFTAIGDVASGPLIRWDGVTWTRAGDGLAGDLRALALFDAGGVPALHAAGLFTIAGALPQHANFAVFDGGAWLPLGGGVNGRVNALAVGEIGGQELLFVAGDFSSAGGVEASRIAAWDGMQWSALGAGIDGPVNALSVFDDGTGPLLIAGGLFANAGGVPAASIAAWDGAGWRALDGGTGGEVLALAVFDAGEGQRLYAGGSLRGLARWDGRAWSIVADLRPPLRSMAVADDGRGPALFLAGNFFSPTYYHVARWDGNALEGVGIPSADPIVAIAGADFGLGPAVFGAESNACCSSPRLVGRYTHAEGWGAAGLGIRSASGYTGGIFTDVYSLNIVGECSEFSLIAGGTFTSAAGVWSPGVARLEDSRWHSFGTEGLRPACFDCPALGLDAFALDGHRDVLVAGAFQEAGGLHSPGLAGWNGAWYATGGLMPCPMTPFPFCPTGLTAACLEQFDDGTGNAIYMGGNFTGVAGVAAPGIARWSGAAWSDVGGGMRTRHTGNWGGCNAMAIYDDGRGPALYAAGAIIDAGGTFVSNIARWNGVRWGTVGTGLTDAARALAVFDDGRGPALYAAGEFTGAGGVAAARVARWNGLRWEALADGLNNRAEALAVFDDGSGAALYAGGAFTASGATPLSFIGRWDGVRWTDVDGGTNGVVHALATGVDEIGPALFVGGRFGLAGGLPGAKIAVYRSSVGCCRCAADCDESTGRGVLDVFDYLCFQSRYDARAPYACDFDTSTGPLVCDIFDFLAFQNAYAAGCK